MPKVSYKIKRESLYLTQMMTMGKKEASIVASSLVERIDHLYAQSMNGLKPTHALIIDVIGFAASQLF